MQISTQIPKKDPPIGGQILKLLGVWEVKPRPPPRMAKTQPLFTEPHIDYSDSQLAPSDNVYVDREYNADSPA